MLLAADDHLSTGAVYLQNVEGRASSDAQSLALPDCEILNAAVLADYLASGSHEFARGIRQGVALLSKVGVKKLLVVAAGHKTDFLRIGLVRQHEPVVARELANL